jgi:hypothetical protein
MLMSPISERLTSVEIVEVTDGDRIRWTKYDLETKLGISPDDVNRMYGPNGIPLLRDKKLVLSCYPSDIQGTPRTFSDDEILLMALKASQENNWLIFGSINYIGQIHIRRTCPRPEGAMKYMQSIDIGLHLTPALAETTRLLLKNSQPLVNLLTLDSLNQPHPE